MLAKHKAMGIDTLMIYFAAAVISTGMAIAIAFRMSYSVADLESKITGIWTNESKTLRILIYSLESRFKAEVVWTRNSEVNLLGSDVIRNLSLKYFSGGEGIYIDPFTKLQFDLKLKFKSAECLHFYLMDKSGGGVAKVESWKPVK